MKLKRFVTLPNCITMLRILSTPCLLLTRVFSRAYFVIYTLCGLSDVLDGFAARVTKQESRDGARLDSIADLLFYTVSLLIVMPELWRRLPRGIWYPVGLVLTIRMAAYLTAALRFHCFAAVHTYLNKATSVGVFALPYLLQYSAAVPYCAALCAVAGLASAEELLMHMLQREYRPDRKSLLQK